MPKKETTPKSAGKKTPEKKSTRKKVAASKAKTADSAAKRNKAEESAGEQKTPSKNDLPVTSGRWGRLKQAASRKAQNINDEYIEGNKLDGTVARIDRWLNYLVPARGKNIDNEAVKEASGPIRVGLWAFLVIFVVIGLWAAIAPLESAAIAPGTVVLDANKKSIQHLEGGIVDEILVRDGDSVQAGQPLIRLSETNPGARAAIVAKQLRSARATHARLLAERDELPEVMFPEALLETQDDPEIQEMMDAQRRLFATRMKAYTGQVDVLGQRIKQLNDEIDGLRAQEKAASDQISLIKEEVDVVEKLVSEGKAIKPRLLALKRQAAELEGNRGEYLSLIARAQQSITENELEIINIRNRFQSDILSQLKDTQAEIADLEERAKAADDVLSRIVITAPVAGVVTDLKTHTIGGVIQPGAVLLQIIPQDDEQIIEASVSPQDIDIVHVGLKARVRLSAYKARSVPMIKGEVVMVSADRFVDEKTGRAYYKARVRLDKKMLASLQQKVELYPGMPAEVLIVTGKKTFLSYMLDPITDHFNRAFREQ